MSVSDSLDSRELSGVLSERERCETLLACSLIRGVFSVFNFLFTFYFKFECLLVVWNDDGVIPVFVSL